MEFILYRFIIMNYYELYLLYIYVYNYYELYLFIMYCLYIIFYFNVFNILYNKLIIYNNYLFY